MRGCMSIDTKNIHYIILCRDSGNGGSSITLPRLSSCYPPDIDRISDGSVPLPAVDVGRVAWSSADVQLLTGDGNSDGGITTGFQLWNTDGDVEDQYETLNGMPLYYGGDLYDSEDSDWDPYTLDVDRLDNVDYDDSDVWSVTDFSNCSSNVDMEDDCVFNMISVRSGSENERI